MAKVCCQRAGFKIVKWSFLACAMSWGPAKVKRIAIVTLNTQGSSLMNGCLNDFQQNCAQNGRTITEFNGFLSLSCFFLSFFRHRVGLSLRVTDN